MSCPEASNEGTHVDVEGTQTQPGDAGGGGETGDGSDPSTETAPADPAPAAPECATALCRDNYSVEVMPEVTLEDLASFAPPPPTLTGEPAGLGVAGMSTNVIATAAETVRRGELFDRDVAVRFTPTQFVFSYGDGASQTTASPGRTWAQWGQSEFTPTPTAHVYAEPGRYAASVTVRYAAAVDFGLGWRVVPGFVDAVAPEYPVRIVAVHTALVERSCVEDPRGPGC